MPKDATGADGRSSRASPMRRMSRIIAFPYAAAHRGSRSPATAGRRRCQIRGATWSSSSRTLPIPVCSTAAIPSIEMAVAESPRPAAWLTTTQIAA